MKTARAILTALLVVGMVPALAPAEPKKPAPPSPPAPASLDADTVLGTPVLYANLTVIPLLAAGAVNATRYLTLDDGMGRGLVTVREQGDGSVNTLVVENKGELFALFLLSGEVIIGGKQDRIIGKETLIGPKESAAVPVFCVEHGRWTEQLDGKSFKSAGALAHSKLRRDASYRGQGQVWDEVAKTNAAKGTTSSTDTYRAVATGKTDEAIAAYSGAIGPALDKAAAGGKLVGVALAVNGRIVAVERFRAPALFAQLRGKLLRSYYLDAATLPVEAAAKASPGAPEIAAFLVADKEATTQVVFEDDGVLSSQVHGKDKKGSRVVNKRAAAAKPVYENVQADDGVVEDSPTREPRHQRLQINPTDFN